MQLKVPSQCGQRHFEPTEIGPPILMPKTFTRIRIRSASNPSASATGSMRPSRRTHQRPTPARPRKRPAPRRRRRPWSERDGTNELTTALDTARLNRESISMLGDLLLANLQPSADQPAAGYRGFLNATGELLAQPYRKDVSENALLLRHYLIGHRDGPSRHRQSAPAEAWPAPPQLQGADLAGLRACESFAHARGRARGHGLNRRARRNRHYSSIARVSNAQGSIFQLISTLRRPSGEFRTCWSLSRTIPVPG